MANHPTTRGMNTSRWSIVCGCCAFCAWALVAFADPNLQLAPQEGLLLLRNGQVMAGRITRSGDRYFVWLDHGQIRIPAGEVDLFCRDIEEGYRLKSGKVTPGRIYEHLALAEWCLNQQMIGHAAEQLTAAVAIDAQHPRIALLERRLRLLMTDVQPVEEAAEQEIAGPSGEVLDRLVKDLPEGTVSTFTQAVQPLLINNCTTSGCHGQQAEHKYQLIRFAAGTPPRRRITQRNLYHTLEWIDRDRPLDSPLIQKSLVAHGGAKDPVFSHTDTFAFQQFAYWVQSVSGHGKRFERDAKLAPAAVEAAPAAANPSEPTVGWPGVPAPAVIPGSTPARPSQRAWPEHEVLAQPTAKPQQLIPPGKEMPATGQIGADPFDPAIFNTKYHPDLPKDE